MAAREEQEERSRTPRGGVLQQLLEETQAEQDPTAGSSNAPPEGDKGKGKGKRKGSGGWKGWRKGGRGRKGQGGK